MKTSTMDANVNEKGPTGHHGTTGFADSTVPSGGAEKRATVTTTTTTQPQNLQSSQFSQQQLPQQGNFGNQTQQQFQRRENQVNMLWRRAKDGFQQFKRKVENYSSEVPMSKYAIPLLLLAVFLALWANGAMQGLKDKLVPSSSSFVTKTVQQAPPQQVCFPVPNTQNMMPNTGGSVKDYVPDSNTFKNMMPNTGSVKDYVPDSNTVKNMMPNAETVKDSVKNMMPNTDSVKDTVNQYIPNADTVKNMMPNSETFKNMMPHSTEQQYKTQQIKTEIVQEFPVPKQAVPQGGSKQYHTQQTFDGNQDASSFSEKLSQAGEAIKASYDRVKEKVAGTTGNE
jgi:hypothetical protein